MSDLRDLTVEEIEARHAALTSRAAILQQGKSHIEAELAARKRSLKKILDEVRAGGLDPSNLDEEIRKLKTTLSLKLDVIESELNEAEKIIKPMLAEIQRD